MTCSSVTSCGIVPVELCKFHEKTVTTCVARFLIKHPSCDDRCCQDKIVGCTDLYNIKQLKQHERVHQYHLQLFIWQTCSKQSHRGSNHIFEKALTWSLFPANQRTFTNHSYPDWEIHGLHSRIQKCSRTSTGPESLLFFNPSFGGALCFFTLLSFKPT